MLYPLRRRNRQANFSPRAPRRRCCGLDEAFESKKRLRHRFERSAMDRTRPEFMEFQEMDLSAVTFMLAEAILRKNGTEVTHHSVSGNFRDHTGSSDSEAEAIAIDNSSLGNWKGDNGQAIDQHMVWRAGERCNGLAHRSVRRARPAQAVWNRSGTGDGIFPEE